MAAGEWLEVIVQVGAAEVDDLAALIVAEIPAASAGTEQRGDEVVFWVSVEDAPAALTATRDTLARWQAEGASVDPTRVRLAQAMPEAEWRDAWKRYFKISRLTRQFVVVPSWETFAPEPGDVVIDLDPGMAFGTGTHASTRLVLEEMQALADSGVGATRILDVGCGSGILSIAAVKRWPGSTCVAVDNDPIAVDATMDNAAVNRVADRIEASTTPAGELTEQFPLVLANIQAHVLRGMREALIARTAPGGTLILSGLLTPQAEPLAIEFVAAGMKCRHIRPSSHDPEWSVVTLTR
ncbi:MAG: 50S ribosomal protein L11 methyltransferase [Kofleriaceae bacterium]